MTAATVHGNMSVRTPATMSTMTTVKQGTAVETTTLPTHPTLACETDNLVVVNDENVRPTSNSSFNFTRIISDKIHTTITSSAMVAKDATTTTSDSILPTTRQLNQTMCKIIDQDKYGHDDAMDALRKLRIWAERLSVEYGHQLLDLGGLRQVLFYFEDQMDTVQSGDTAAASDSSESINGILDLLLALIKPEPKDGSDIVIVKLLMAKKVVEFDGVELILKAFDYHALLSVYDADTLESTDEMGDDTNAGIWNSFKTIWSCDENPNRVLEDIVNKSCVGGNWDRLGRDYGSSTPDTTGDNPALLAPTTTVFTTPDSAVADSSMALISKGTAAKSMQVLAIVMAHASSAQASNVVEAICTKLPPLLTATKFCDANSKNASLFAFIMACLVAALCLGGGNGTKNSGYEQTDNQQSQKVVTVTVQVMKDYPHQKDILKICCMVLRQVSPQLSKQERKHLGVIAALGAVLASDTIDQDVKDIADAILEEQFA